MKSIQHPDIGKWFLKLISEKLTLKQNSLVFYDFYGHKTKFQNLSTF